MRILGFLGFLIFQVGLKIFTFQIKIYLNLLDLLLFRNAHHSSVGLWDNLRVGLLHGRIFVSSVGLYHAI